jgi:hypothetical protein
MFALAVDGKTTKKGMPNRCWHARWGAPVGKALGYDAVYEPSGQAEAAVA